MPPKYTRPANTDPSVRAIKPEDAPSSRGGVGRRLLGWLAAEQVQSLERRIQIVDMNIAETYGIKWDVEKCGRDAFQNFFDANGGTLDGVAYEMEERQEGMEHLYDVIIRGEGTTYDYKDLTLLGATTKKSGEQTAGGFGEGAKVLALSLLRDHKVERVMYRSDDWQLEFYLDDLPEEKTARPARGLFARVATGLDRVDGSEMVITCRDKFRAQGIIDTNKLFCSSENPDFQDTTLEKTLQDGSLVSVKFLGTQRTWREELAKGNLYVAGQRRHYDAYGTTPNSWNTVEGMSITTTRDIASGDRDRSSLNSHQIETELFGPFASELSKEEVARFILAIEPAYELMSLSALDKLTSVIVSRGKTLGVRIQFNEKYVACNPWMDSSVRGLLEEQGYVLCPHYFGDIGMKTSNDVVREIHEHQRKEPTPEHLAKIAILDDALETIKAGSIKKEFESKEIALYSKVDENNPAHGTHSEDFVWIAVEHLETEGFAKVFATYLHELDHRYGGDESVSFSYALTDTLAEILIIVSSNPDVASQWQVLAKRWEETRAVK